jgi:hypothetical protein
MLLLKKATDSTLKPCSVHAVKSSLETDVLRLTNQLNGVSLFFLCYESNRLPEHPSRIVLSIEKGKKGEQALFRLSARSSTHTVIGVLLS